MTAKQWLSRGTYIDRELEELRRARQAVYERLTATVGVLGAIKETSPDPHKYDKIAHLSAQIEAEEKKLDQTKAEILETIYRLEDRRYRELLLMKYVQGCTWAEIAGQMGYARRHISRLHGCALEEIRKLVPGVK